MKLGRILLAAAIATIVVPSSALAEEAEVAKDKDGKGYGYKFEDDKLLGDNFGANAAQITVLRLGKRDRLLRPRLHFVPEMLKSVENL
jgi:hypothetical protein